MKLLDIIKEEKMNKKTKLLILVIGILIILGISLFLIVNSYKKAESFSVNTVLLKLNILENEESVKYILVQNNENALNEVNIYSKGLGDEVIIEESRINLQPKESRNIKITFKDSGKGIGVYSGLLIVENEELQKKIPIVLGIEDKNRIFAIVQSSVPKYDNVYPGGKLGVNIKTFNLLNNNLSTVKIEYQIKGLEDNLILFEEENAAIQGSFETTKLVDVPVNLASGDYVFITSIIYDGHKSSSGYIFRVGQKEEIASSGSSNLFTGGVVAFIFVILILFFYFVKSRDELLIELQKQQNQELSRNVRLINYSKRDVECLRNIQEKNKKIKELESLRKKVVSKIKNKQRHQKKIIRKLKKIGRKDLIKQKMAEFEKQGYKMYDTEKEIKRITNKNVKSQIAEWKRKGYDTSILERG